MEIRIGMKVNHGDHKTVQLILLFFVTSQHKNIFILGFEHIEKVPFKSPNLNLKLLHDKSVQTFIINLLDEIAGRKMKMKMKMKQHFIKDLNFK